MKRLSFIPGKAQRLRPVCYGLLLAFLLIFAVSAPAETVLNFPVSSINLPTDESQVLTFAVSEPYAKETSPEWQIEPAGSMQMLIPPRILAGEKIGYFRVRPLQPGVSNIQVDHARLEIRAQKNPKKAGQARLPEFVTPASGSSVWGKIYTAVEIFAPDTPTQTAKLELIGSDNRSYQADPAQSSQSGPWRREVFALETDSWPMGPFMLTPQLSGETGKPVAGAPLILMHSAPDPNNQIAGECEDFLEGAGQERFGLNPLKTNDDPTASGGKSVMAFSGNPAWALKTEIRESGVYQLFMTVRGEPAGGALPSLGFYVDEKERTSGNVRLAVKGWQRVPVGLPTTLEQGPHTLTVQFRNDFNAEKMDRNMWLDRYELAKVQTGGKESAAGQDSMMMSMMASDPSMMATMASSGGSGSSEPVRLAFRDPLDGKSINGPVTIEALCRWGRYDPANAPKVELRINGREVAKQYGSDLRFEVGVDQFHPGKNEMQLFSQSGPARFSSSTQRLFLNVSPQWKAAPGNKEMVFGVLDPAWDEGMHQRWEGKDGEVRREAAFYSNGESFIRLPKEMQGRYKIELEGRGQSFEGPPVFDVALRSNDAESPIGSIQMDGGKVQKTVGTVDLATGTKQLVIRFANDLARDKGDRNVWLRRVRLIEVAKKAENEPALNLMVSYPGLDAKVGPCGMVVIDGLGSRKGDRAEVVLGDQVLGSAEAPLGGLGSWLVPWIRRDAPEGKEKLQVRILRGKEDEVLMNVSIPVDFVGPDVLTDYDKALHVLNRFGYGPEPELVAQILIQGSDNWLETKLREGIDNPGQAALQEAMALRFPGEDRPNDISGRVLAELQQTSNPVRARFVMWAENHFSTWQQKAGALNKWKEHESFYRQGTARFKDLLFTSASSPAMLVYLDQSRSFAKKLNENYAREILELHTVGVKGGYKQDDVTSLARLLTGWTLSEEASPGGRAHDLVSTFRYEPGLNTKGPQQVLGLTFPDVPEKERYDRVCMALEMLAMHPSTAHFISRQLVEHYVTIPAPEELVSTMSQVYLESGGDLPAVLLAMTKQPAFWDSMEKPRMTTPLDYAVRMSRMLDRGGIRESGTFLKLSGMALFDRATPDGYPQSDSSYADSNALLQRWRWSSEFRFAPMKVPWERQAPATWNPEQRQQAVDLMAMRLNGRLLGTQSNNALLQWLSAKNEGRDDMSAQLGIMVARVPESNIR